MTEANRNRRVLMILNSRIAYHLYFWGFFFAGLFIQSIRERTLADAIIYDLSFLSFLILPVYLNFCAITHLFNQKKYYLYSVFLIFITIMTALLMDKVFILFFSEWTMVINRIFTISVILALTTAIKFAKAGFQQRLLFQEIENKQLQTELSLLKAQINPHFLFNTLNNLYGLALRKDDQTAEGIARLSHLMRYMIYESNTEQIELEKEIDQINRLIDLQKLRFLKEDDVDINFSILGEPTGAKVPPMLFIPFIENAFKHGINISEKSFVNFQLKIEDEFLVFSAINSTHKKNDTYDKPDTGVGLNNAKRRLDILYPNAHNLEIAQQENTFEVHLKIKRKL